MIIKNELIKKVKGQFNLNIYETKVWLSLLAKGVASAGEIAEISGVPRSRTYDVLESLEKQGFAIMRLGKPVKYIAVKPSVVIEKLKNNVVKEAEEKSKTLSDLKSKEEYSELELLHKQGIKPIKASELSGAIKGRSNVYAQLKDMLSNSKKEALLMTNLAGIKRKKFLSQLSKKLASKGVKFKIGINANESEYKDFVDKIKADIKKININTRFLMVDGKSVLFMLEDDAPADQEIAIWINSEMLASTLNTLFNPVWK